jgi:hypothetical protein
MGGEDRKWTKIEKNRGNDKEKGTKRDARSDRERDLEEIATNKERVGFR